LLKFKDIWENQTDNLAEFLDDEQLENIGSDIHEQYLEDKGSRKEWENNYASALKLALLVKDQKTFPWPEAANVSYPLVAMACVQYNARAYSALLAGEQLCKPVDGRKEGWAVCKRIDHYVRHEIDDWEENMDKLLLIQALVGCPVKKTYRTDDGVRSELVLPDRFVVNYYAKKVPERATHRLYYSENEFEEHKRMGFFRDVDLRKVHLEHTAVSDVEDEAHGQSKPTSPTGHEILEVHCWYDLDDDGYKEPYIIWLDNDSRQVLRISTRWGSIFMKKGSTVAVEGYDVTLENAGYKIAKIVPEEFFTKYPFIPAPDGSWYDVGFGLLLGSINNATDSILNMLIDAGVLANTQGGLLARNVRVRGGKIEMTPGKFVRTEANAMDLKNGVFPWPIKEPSTVLFSLLQLLIKSGERLGSVTDAMTGENPGQNQAATTTMAVLEQGSQVHNSIYKRTYRSMTSEIRKIKGHLTDMSPNMYGSYREEQSGQMVEFKDSQMMLTADPSVMSQAQRMAKAEALMQRVMAAPHLYGMEGAVEAERNYLEALQINGVEQLLANPQPPQGDPKIEIEGQKVQADGQFKMQQLELDKLKTQSGIQVDSAQIKKMEADAMLAGAKLNIEREKEVLNDTRERAKILLTKQGLEQQSGNGGVPGGANSSNGSS